jgi:hypothetical protein
VRISICGLFLQLFSSDLISDDLLFVADCFQLILVICDLFFRLVIAAYDFSQ